MEELLPKLIIELFVEDREINIDSIQILEVENGFPISEIDLLKQSILNDFDCTGMDDNWIELKCEYIRDFDIGDYYKITRYTPPSTFINESFNINYPAKQNDEN